LLKFDKASSRLSGYLSKQHWMMKCFKVIRSLVGDFIKLTKFNEFLLLCMLAFFSYSDTLIQKVNDELCSLEVITLQKN